MFDLYLFNTIINTIWYIFTILFVLYRFTSFFSYIYNFSRFCGKIFTGIKYVYNYINSKNIHNYHNIDIESQLRPKTTFQKFKEAVQQKWAKMFGKSSSNHNDVPKYETMYPLVETTAFHNSSTFQRNSSDLGATFREGNSSNYTSNYNLEQQLFDDKINELMNTQSNYYDVDLPGVVLTSTSNSKVTFKIPVEERIDLESIKEQMENDIEEMINDINILSSEDSSNTEVEKITKKIKLETDTPYRITKSYSDSDSESEPLFHKYME